MTAQEARQLATEQRDKAINAKLEEIHLTINTAIKKGEFECHYYKSLSKDVKAVLKANGYEIVDGGYDQRDQSYSYTIKW